MTLRIALVGYGKMGKAIEAEALARGHEICLRTGSHNVYEAYALTPTTCDCLIEFTRPEGAMENYRALLQTGIPIVSGTTGWSDLGGAWRAEVLETSGSFLHSSNFSPGVNILFKLNQLLAKLMNRHPEFDCYVEEGHHRHKKDAPSGTAMTLAHQILEGLERKSLIVDADLRHRAPAPEELSVAYTRAGEIVGRHSVSYISEIEEVKISHEAFNRRGFALGAVLAAEWIQGKRGYFDFGDVLS
jgi:4-hydroxy-tetrahydrodipicolinate reductase